MLPRERLETMRALVLYLQEVHHLPLIIMVTMRCLATGQTMLMMYLSRIRVHYHRSQEHPGLALMMIESYPHGRSSRQVRRDHHV